MYTFFICTITTLIIVSGFLGYKLYWLIKSFSAEVEKRINAFIESRKAEVEKFEAEKAEWEKIQEETNANTKALYDQFAQEEIDLYEKSKKLDVEYQQYKDELKQNYDKRMQEAEDEIESALQEAEEAIKANIEQMDDIIEDRLADITAKNTVDFNCVCNDKPIACAIDFTKENTFRCPECGGMYRVDIRMNPVLIGKAVSDEEYIAKIQQRLEDEQY